MQGGLERKKKLVRSGDVGGIRSREQEEKEQKERYGNGGIEGSAIRCEVWGFRVMMDDENILFEMTCVRQVHCSCASLRVRHLDVGKA
jgi:hypothetical protein